MQTAECSNIWLANDWCFDDACICPPILASGLACSSCLATVDADPSDAAFIGSEFTSCKTGPGLILTSDPCAPQCSNIAFATVRCSDNSCLCPTFLASGLGCSSCLATVDADPSDAASIASYYSACKAGPGPTSTPDPCDSPCSNIGLAYSKCSDNACLCPTILSSGPACVSCLFNLEQDFGDAATIKSDYINCIASASIQQSTTATQFTLNPSTPASNFPAKPTSSSQESNNSAAKSDARGFAAEVFGARYIQMIMFIAIVAGLFSAFV